jgi:hypothetical protein
MHSHGFKSRRTEGVSQNDIQVGNDMTKMKYCPFSGMNKACVVNVQQ